MCRLYGFVATEATKVECTLVHAQNALMAQSRQDSRGFSHADGWGIAFHKGNRFSIERRAIAAYRGESFERAASRAHSRLVIAHVRRATVGEISLANTHPFAEGAWVFAHNGTVPNFAHIRERMLGEMTPSHRAAIRGSTDSEHIFRFLLSLQTLRPKQSPGEVLGDGLKSILAWSEDAGVTPSLGLNVLWSNGRTLLGSRLGRPLWYVEREGVRDCEVCGFPHVQHDPQRTYRACVLASEPISHEPWAEIPNEVVFTLDDDARIRFEPLK